MVFDIVTLSTTASTVVFRTQRFVIPNVTSRILTLQTMAVVQIRTFVLLPNLDRGEEPLQVQSGWPYEERMSARTRKEIDLTLVSLR